MGKLRRAPLTVRDKRTLNLLMETETGTLNDLLSLLTTVDDIADFVAMEAENSIYAS